MYMVLPIFVDDDDDDDDDDGRGCWPLEDDRRHLLEKNSNVRTSRRKK